jgi:hypothetical protein
MEPESYLVGNIVLLIGACAVLYALVYRLTASWLAASAAGLALLVDPSVMTITKDIVEARQTALACIVGFLALLAVLAPPVRARPGLIAVTVFVLLLLAGLGKEYGLAFSAAVVVAAMLNRSARSKSIVAAALGAVLAYAALRWLVVGGAAGDYCQDMGYFDQLRMVCYGHIHDTGAVLLTGGARLTQYAYNLGVAFIGIFLPFLFNDKGSIISNISVPLVVWSLVVLVLAIVAWIRIPRRALPFLVLIAANSVLSLPVYRERNVVIGVAGLYVAAALGAVQATEWLRSRDIRLHRLGIAAGAAAIVLWGGYQSQNRANDLEHVYRDRQQTLLELQDTPQNANADDPCLHMGGNPYVDRGVVHYIKVRYHLPDPWCRVASRHTQSLPPSADTGS